jgi:hypothetical protein
MENGYDGIDQMLLEIAQVEPLDLWDNDNGTSVTWLR